MVQLNFLNFLMVQYFIVIFWTILYFILINDIKVWRTGDELTNNVLHGIYQKGGCLERAVSFLI